MRGLDVAGLLTWRRVEQMVLHGERDPLGVLHREIEAQHARESPRALLEWLIRHVVYQDPAELPQGEVARTWRRRSP